MQQTFPKYVSLPLALALAVAGCALNAAVQLPVHNAAALNLRLGAVIFGHVCRGCALLIAMIRGDGYVEQNVPEDGYGRAAYNLVKWGSVTLFLIFDAFVLERAYEGYFIVGH